MLAHVSSHGLLPVMSVSGPLANAGGIIGVNNKMALKIKVARAVELREIEPKINQRI